MEELSVVSSYSCFFFFEIQFQQLKLLSSPMLGYRAILFLCQYILFFCAQILITVNDVVECAHVGVYDGTYFQ